MKNKGLIVALIIFAVVIALILSIFLIGYLIYKNNFNGIINIGSKSTNIIFDKQWEVKDIENINIDQDTGDVIIKESTDNYIEVVMYGKDVNDVQVNLNEGDLDISYKHKENFVFFNIGSTQNDIIIYIPSDYSNKIKVKNDYGKCKISDLINATVDLYCDAGDVELGKIKNSTIKCDCGNIIVKEILNKCDIKSDCGNIEIDKIDIKENSNIKSNLGNVTIKQTNIFILMQMLI